MPAHKYTIFRTTLSNIPVDFQDKIEEIIKENKGYYNQIYDKIILENENEQRLRFVEFLIEKELKINLNDYSKEYSEEEKQHAPVYLPNSNSSGGCNTGGCGGGFPGMM